MGNSNKKAQDYDVVRSFSPEEWINKQKKSGYQIWENTSRNLTADVYPIHGDLKSADFDHYQMRYNNSQDIVKVHNIRVDREAGLCAKSSDSHVFVERIPARLNDISDLSQEQALSVLRSSYSGFNTISTFYGPIEPYQDLICFNERGNTKVWVNSNLSQNNVQKQRQQNPVGNIINANSVFVNKIFSMVQNRTASKSLPEKLKNKFRQANPKSYFEALNLVEQYAHQQNINIPTSINGVSQRSNRRISNVLQNSSHVQNYNIVNQPTGAISNSTFNPNQSYINRNSTQSVYQPSTNLAQSQHQAVYQSQVPSHMPSQSTYTFVSPNNDSNKLKQFDNSFVAPPVSQPLPIFHQGSVSSRSIISQNLSNQNFTNRQIAPLSPQNIQSRQGYPINSKFQPPSNVISFQTVKSNPSITSPDRPNRTSQIVSPIKTIPASPVKQNRVNINEQTPNSIRDQRLNGVAQLKPQSQRIPLQIQQNQVRIVPNQVIQNNQFNQFRQYNNQSPFYRPNINYSHTPSYPSNYTYGQTQPNQQRIVFPPQIITKEGVNISQNISHPQHQQQVTQQKYQIKSQVLPQQPQAQVQTQIQSQVHNQIQSQVQTQVQSQSQQNNSIQQVEKKEQISSSVAQNKKQPQQDYLNEEQKKFRGIVSSQEQANSEESVEDEAERQLELLQQQKFFNQQEIMQHMDEKQYHQRSSQSHKASEHGSDERNYFPFGRKEVDSQIEVIKRVETGQIRQNLNLYENTEKNIFVETEQNKQVQTNQQAIQQPSRVHINDDQQFAGYKNQAKINRQREKSEIADIQTSQKQQTQSISQTINIEQSQQVNNSQQDPYVSSNTGYSYQYQRSMPIAKESERIPDNARYQDIQQYIRNKYKSYIGTGDIETVSNNFYAPHTSNATRIESQFRQSSTVKPYNAQYTETHKPDVVEMAQYVEHKYDQYNGSNSLVNNYDYVNQDIQFSFRPNKIHPDLKQQTSNKFEPSQSYEYMRIERMYDSPGQSLQNNVNVKENDDKKSSEKKQEPVDDLLDVKNMERSLDKKYSSMKSQQQIKQVSQLKPSNEEENQFDVKKLQENLIRFEESRVGSGQITNAANTPEARFQTSQVSKIHSIDDRIGGNRRSSMNRDVFNNNFTANNFQVKSQFDYGKYDFNSYENQSPRKSGVKSKVSRELSSIDQKFSKYVQMGGATNVSAVKTALRQKEDNGYLSYENNSSRLATGHFGFADNDKKGGYDNQSSKHRAENSYANSIRGSRAQNQNQKTKLVTSDVKGLTYEDLRKFMWS